MANGKHTYGSDGGGTVSITVPSGVTTNTTVTLQNKNGTVSRLEDNGGRKNYLINGNFDKWDYATSQTTSGYGSDNRWFNYNIGSTKTHSQVACTDVERALFNANHFSRTVVSSVAGANNVVLKDQHIEDVTKLAGKTVTLSFWAKADSNKNIAVDFSQYFGSGGNPSTVVDNGAQKVALTTTWQKKIVTVTIPNIIGKTIGTDGVHTSSTYIVFWFDAGSNLNSRTDSLGQQSGTFDIAQVKLEDGSVATDGWHPYDGEFGSEVQACGRYFLKYIELLYVGNVTNGVSYASMLMLPVSMRTTPTATFIANIGLTGFQQPTVSLLESDKLKCSAIAGLTGLAIWDVLYQLSAEL